MKLIHLLLLTAGLFAPLSACGQRGKLKTPDQIAHDTAKKAAKAKKAEEQKKSDPQAMSAPEALSEPEQP